MEQHWHIYKITHIDSNKSYIGQTQSFKYKNNKAYNYGVLGRWYDHISSSKRSTAPVHKAIREFGATSFTYETIEEVSQEMVDEREAFWISHYNTITPNGFNVMGHSRCKHRTSSSIENAFLENATQIERKIIKKNGEPKLVYIYITLPTAKKRITFGQSSASTFEDAMAESNVFIQPFLSKGIPLVEENKHKEFENQVLQSYRMVPFNKTMTALYITNELGKKIRICFGGKTISYEKSIENANEFLRGLKFKTN